MRPPRGSFGPELSWEWDGMGEANKGRAVRIREGSPWEAQKKKKERKKKRKKK